MRRLYAFLLSLFVLTAIVTDRSFAQTYQMTDFNVRLAPQNASGANFVPLSAATSIAGLAQYYYTCSSPIPFPFNFRFLNQSYTSSNTFTINGTGSIILSQSYQPYTYDYSLSSVYGYMYDYSQTSGHKGSISGSYFLPYDLYYAESGSNYPDFKVAPMEFYNYNAYIPNTAVDISYATIGTAPNRQLVVQTLNNQDYYGYATRGAILKESHQAVLYENGVSKFQFNYGMAVGTVDITNDYQYNWGYGYTYNGGSYRYYYEGDGVVCGIKANGSNNLLTIGFNSPNHSYVDPGGKNGQGDDGSAPVWGCNSQTAQYTLDAAGNKQTYVPDPSYGSAPYMGNSNCNIPQVSYVIQLAWPNDISADFSYMSTNSSGTKGYPSFQDGAKLYPCVQITNQGVNTPTSVLIKYRITRLGASTYSYSFDKTVTTGLPAKFQSQLVVFNGPGETFTLPTGSAAWDLYEDTVTVSILAPGNDQDPSNNQCSDEWLCSPPHDIRAVQITGVAPPAKATALNRTPVGFPAAVSARFRNIGSALQDEFNVPVSIFIKDKFGNVVDRDTQIVSVFKAGVDTDISFLNFTPVTNGIDSVFAVVLANFSQTYSPGVQDMFRGDDTAKSAFEVAYEHDVKTLSVFSPTQDEERVYFTSWRPGAYFTSVGASPGEFDPKTNVRLEIRRCSDGQLVYRADSTVPELNSDNPRVPFFFPAKQGQYDVSKIPPGCYNICAISRLAGDGDPSNDTACANFSVIDRLKGDIYVGVGQRFQTLHAAVDSAAYRGIGANVRFLLTDNNYTENGTYAVSNQKGALDFSLIRGLSDTSTLTILPKPGVQPTITFTGTRPYCFYFGDARTGPTTSQPVGFSTPAARPHIIFEGFNPLGIAPPDQIVPEPQKRTMTIIDNATVAGGIFSIEMGASNIVLKDMRLIGNGMTRVDDIPVPLNNLTKSVSYGISRDSDAVVRIYNEHTTETFNSGIMDTVAIHDIRIDNCEIAGGKYGIYDHGQRDGFQLPSGPFKVWRNYNNVFTRNTIGTAANPIGYAGIQINHERDLVISHNDISNVNATAQPVVGYTNPFTNSLNATYRNLAYGIVSADPRVYLPQGTGYWPGDTGNVTRVWIDGNRIHNIKGTNAYGIAINQTATFSYQNFFAGQYPSGNTWDTLPKTTQNRATNNMIYDLQGSSVNMPVLFQTVGGSGSSTLGIWSTDQDSVFANSISTSNANSNITMLSNKHVFLWDNIIQNTGTGAYTNYTLQVPRPYASAISSDYNLFDLRGINYKFATVAEYVVFGNNVTTTQNRTFRRLNDWRTYVGQDRHSLEGDPKFVANDPLNLPPAVSGTLSPATANGYMLPTGSMTRDFFGNLRSVATNVPNIGASDVAGFQYNNDLAVLSINQPMGYSVPGVDTTTLVTIENPLWINATIKNLSSQGVFGASINAKVEVSISGGGYTTLYNSNSPAMNWDINEAKNVVWQGPSLTKLQAANGLFRVVITVPGDQNNANNSLTKYFKVLLKSNATVVSYNASDVNGIGAKNRDSVTAALNRIGLQYDLIDRNTANDIDYSPYWTVIWASGDPSATKVGNGVAGPGTSNLSFKEIEELTRYLNQSQTYAKKSLIMAGQNIARALDDIPPSSVDLSATGAAVTGGTNQLTDTAFAHQYLHIRYAQDTVKAANGTITSITGGDYPSSTQPYNGQIMGQNPLYWNSVETINSLSPDVVKPADVTAPNGPVVNGFAYSYLTHPRMPKDSGAGVTYYNPLMNTVFFGFDWSDPKQQANEPQNIRTSGVTRILNGALQFIQSHAGTILPVEFASVKAERTNAASASVKWTMADQADIASFDVESNEAGVWSSVGSTSKHSSNDYAHSVSIEPTKSYTFRVVAVDRDGAKHSSNTVELGPLAPQGVELGQSFPNPTSATSEVKFSLPTASQVTLRVLDVTGKVVKTVLANEAREMGQQVVTIDMSDVASGSYVYELTATDANGLSVTKSNKLTVSK